MIQKLNLNFLIIIVLLVFYPFLWHCKSTETPARVVVARVNQVELTLEMIQASLPSQFKAHVKTIHIKEFVDRWVDNQIFYQEALRRGIHRENAVLYEIEQMRQQVIVSYMLENELQRAVTASKEDIQSYYDKNKEQFIRPKDLVHFYQILSDSLGKISRIRSRILRGEDFENMAREYSMDPSAQNGGDMGWMNRNQLLPQIEVQAFRLKKGALSQPIKTELGYHLIKVIEIRPKEEIQELDEVEQIISERVKSRNRAEKYGHLLAILKDAARVEVNLNNADELIVK